MASTRIERSPCESVELEGRAATDARIGRIRSVLVQAVRAARRIVVDVFVDARSVRVQNREGGRVLTRWNRDERVPELEKVDAIVVVRVEFEGDDIVRTVRIPEREGYALEVVLPA